MNIGQLLTKSARTYPNNLALAYGSTKLNYAQFASRTNRLANALHRLGIRPGDNIALLQYNNPEMLVSLFACFKAGCGAVPINFRLHPNEFAFIIDHSDAKAVIFSPEFNQSMKASRERLPKVRHFITLAGSGGGLLDYETLLLQESDQFSDVDVHPDDVAWLFYTSGTTGMPKGAMLTHRNLLAMTMNFYADMCPGFGPDDVALHAAPLSHGSGCYALPNIGKAAANVILESKTFDPELVFKTIEQYRVTNMFAAPTMINVMIDSSAMDRSKDMIISGGENIYPREIEEVLIRHSAVREVAVIGIPDLKWGEAVKAVVALVSEQSVTEKGLIDFCKDNIASYKKPQSVDFVGELPKNNYGKILKRELRAKYWKDKDRKV